MTMLGFKQLAIIFQIVNARKARKRTEVYYYKKTKTFSHVD